MVVLALASMLRQSISYTTDMTNKDVFGANFIKEAMHQLFDEALPRLRKCIDELNDEQLWSRPNEHSNSAGNLILHLNGNIKQWIISGLGNTEDLRVRHSEFDNRSEIPKSQLINELEEVMGDAKKIVSCLQPDELIHKRHIQGFYETGISMLLHVVEHYSYHVGQITYIVKSLKNMDMGYYDGEDLNQSN